MFQNGYPMHWHTRHDVYLLLKVESFQWPLQLKEQPEEYREPDELQKE